MARPLAVASILASLTILLGLAARLGWAAGAEKDLLLALALTKASAAEGSIATAQWISRAGNPDIRLYFILAAALALAWRRDWASAAVMIAVPVCAGISSSMLKLAFARARPELVPHLDTVTSLAYPSGHAVNAAAIALLAALLIARGPRAGWVAMAAAAAATVGLSRLMLGVHWPSDVVGGWMWGAAWALAGYGLALRFRGSRRRVHQNGSK